AVQCPAPARTATVRITVRTMGGAGEAALLSPRGDLLRSRRGRPRQRGRGGRAPPRHGGRLRRSRDEGQTAGGLRARGGPHHPRAPLPARPPPFPPPRPR